MPKRKFVSSGAPSSAEASVVEANLRFYREIASKYDACETCVSDGNLQQLLDKDVDRITQLLGTRDRPVECLDCGGGSGNLSLKMLRKGWLVTVVDVSPDMLAILEAKARTEGYAPRLVNDSISTFLSTTHDTYDVVTFNSVLHHLYRYLPIVSQCVGRIRTGGIFYSNFDPIIPLHPSLFRYFETFDTAVAKLVHDRSDFLPGAVRRVRKCFRKDDERYGRPVLSSGDLAEYHAKTGVDDVAVIRYLEQNGFLVREHTRWTCGRTALAKAINRRLRLMEISKIVAQREL